MDERISCSSQEVKFQEKYILTIKEASMYFNIGIKKIRRMAESNEGAYALFLCNRNLIIRHRFEKYLDGLAQMAAVQNHRNDE